MIFRHSFKLTAFIKASAHRLILLGGSSQSWRLTSSSGPTPPGERPISYYNIDLLPKRWNKVQALPILRSYDAMI
ncbi:hypothetical protein C8J55DRAFT_609442 [Lentinula edodes]|uniref:Uncharacterized protein n=1 Tax=Lentinula lateritia TaxID=40482 RepID=A0A9W8ZSS5_9AGAR|nr:hypothetical protein C8J55DRAFT_609442 [Lentinula edodes]